MADSDLIINLLLRDEMSAKMKQAQAVVDDMCATEKKWALIEHEQARASQEVENATGKQSSAVNALKGSWTEMTSAIGAAKEVMGTIGKIMDFGQEGATILQLNASFKTLMGSEQAAVDMERKLSDAVHGTMDGEQLQGVMLKMLTGATGVFADELKGNAATLYEMAGAVAKINPMLGDTTSVLDSMSQSLEMGTTRGLKRMGIIIDQTKAEETYAASIGKTRDQLDEEEKKVAVLNATLTYHDRLLQQAGGSTESLVDPFKRLSTAVEDAGEKYKTALAPGIAKAAEAMALLLTWNDKLDSALKKHGEDVLKSSDGYAAYSEEMKRAASAAGYVVDKWGNLVTVGHKVIEANYLQSQSTYEIQREWAALLPILAGTGDKFGDVAMEIEAATKAADKNKAAIEANKAAMAFLSLTIAGPLKKEYDSFIQKQADLAGQTDDLKTKISELESKSWLSAAQVAQLDEYKVKLGEVGVAVQDNAQAHDDATKRIMFDLLQQRAAIDGVISDVEIKALNEVALKWGIVDQETHDAVISMDDALAGLAASGNIDLFIQRIGGIGSAAQAAAEALAGLAVPGVDMPGGPASHRAEAAAAASPAPTGAANRPGGAQGFAAGGSFIVPPGFSGDTYPMRVSSGERVTVTPASENATSNSINIQVTDTLAAAYVIEQARRGRLGRASEAM